MNVQTTANTIHIEDSSNPSRRARILDADALWPTAEFFGMTAYGRTCTGWTTSSYPTALDAIAAAAEWVQGGHPSSLDAHHLCKAAYAIRKA